MATDPLPYTDADREIDAGLAALERLLHGPLVNTPVTHGLAALALALARLRERVAALEAKEGRGAELARRCDHLAARQAADFTLLQELVDGLARKCHDAETRLAAVEAALAARGDAGQGE